MLLCLSFLPQWARSAGECVVGAGEMMSVQGPVEIRRATALGWQPVRLGNAICAGDTVRIGRNARAAILLANETLLRLDQGTTVTFSEVAADKPTWLELLKGALHLISRTPRSLQINTPYANAGVEGTEFAIRVGSGKAELWVFEGRVSFRNDSGALSLDAAEAAVAQAGQAPKRRIVVRPRDAVQWALYYPPVIDFRTEAKNADDRIGAALRDYRSDDITAALAGLDFVPRSDRDAEYFALRAGLLLSVGRVVEAGADIERARSKAPGNAVAVALEAVVAVAQNRNEEAMRLAERAVELDAASPVAQVALSYAHQAQFDLPAARQAARRAVDLDPDNALAWARLSELDLSLGESRDAVAHAQKAASLDPEVERSQTVLGYGLMIRGRAGEAAARFERAIALDPASPLPRLGLGLARIRKGELDQGVGQIEIAASLDPNNALIRSYLGKGYFEQKRDDLAGVEYANAKALDPNDPTAYLYDSLLKQTTNRPVAALRDNQRAKDLNDNRAVFRSRLLLDEDVAARSAAQARIFQDLGFGQLGLLEGVKAVNTDPANFSAHRLLADTYANLPRHEIARVSELLQSQLLQPLNVAPIQPQMAVGNLAILRTLGPARPSLNEYTPLFTRNSVSAQINALVGNHETFADDVLVSGIYDNLSLSAGQFHYETSGYRDNNDHNQDIVNLFGQYNVSPELSFQLEARHRRREFGDLEQRYDDSFNPLDRREIKRKSLRGGLRYSWTPRSHLLASLIYEEDKDVNHIARKNLTFPGLPLPVDVGIDSEDDARGKTAELRYIFQERLIDFTLGAGWFEADSTVTIESVASSGGFILPFPLSSSPPPTDLRFTHENVYGYADVRPFGPMARITLGLSYNEIDDDRIGSTSQVNPKFGIVWTPSNRLTLRAAAFRTLDRRLLESKTLEPTQLAGFNQFFDDFAGTDATRLGAAIDFRVTSDLFVGAELTRRTLNAPVENSNAEIDQDEELHRAYAYWMATPRLALRAEFVYDDYASDKELDPQNPVVGLRTKYVPLGVSYFDPTGFFATGRATYVQQDVNLIQDSQQESFWTVDASLGYRLPRRTGTVSLQVRNIFDRYFSFQDSDFRAVEPQNPLFLPTRSVFLNINLAL